MSLEMSLLIMVLSGPHHLQMSSLHRMRMPGVLQQTFLCAQVHTVSRHMGLWHHHAGACHWPGAQEGHGLCVLGHADSAWRCAFPGRCCHQAHILKGMQAVPCLSCRQQLLQRRRLWGRQQAGLMQNWCRCCSCMPVLRLRSDSRTLDRQHCVLFAGHARLHWAVPRQEPQCPAAPG